MITKLLKYNYKRRNNMIGYQGLLKIDNSILRAHEISSQNLLKHDARQPLEELQKISFPFIEINKRNCFIKLTPH